MKEEKALVIQESAGSLIPSKHEYAVYAALAQNANKMPYISRSLGGEAGIVSVMLYARELGVPPMTAVFQGFHNIEGRIELSARLLTGLIRKRGHTLKIIETTPEKAEIYGKRADTGEEYTAKHTIEDAQRAGLVKPSSNWVKVPEDMCFARAVSKLARRLFADVIGTAYVEGEIQELAEQDPAPPEQGPDSGAVLDAEWSEKPETDEKAPERHEKEQTQNTDTNGYVVKTFEQGDQETATEPQEKEKAPEEAPEVTQEETGQETGQEPAKPDKDVSSPEKDPVEGNAYWETVRKAFINMRSGSALQKYVKANIHEFPRWEQSEAGLQCLKDLEAKWNKFVDHGKIELIFPYGGVVNDEKPNTQETEQKDAEPEEDPVSMVKEMFVDNPPSREELEFTSKAKTFFETAMGNLPYNIDTLNEFLLVNLRKQQSDGEFTEGETQLDNLKLLKEAIIKQGRFKGMLKHYTPWLYGEVKAKRISQDGKTIKSTV